MWLKIVRQQSIPRLLEVALQLGRELQSYEGAMLGMDSDGALPIVRVPAPSNLRLVRHAACSSSS